MPSHSIWNENPTLYYNIKRTYSVLVTPIYPFAIYCVLRKSPESFGSLKWILSFHVVCITLNWMTSAFLIDVLEFQPSVVARIDGFLKNHFDSVLLYVANVIVEQITITSGLYLFCSRLLLIINIYKPVRSTKRYFFELFLYFLLTVFGFWVVPALIFSIPPQHFEKIEIITSQIEEFYPDSLMDPTVVVVTAADSYLGDYIALLIVLNYFLIAILLFSSAHLAFNILNRNYDTASEATRKMHQKFNRRTIFQASIYIFFACIPFTVLYVTVFFRLHINGMTYTIDLLSENYSTACAVTLFLYYDPYQRVLLKVLRCGERNGVVKSSTVVHVVN